MHPSSSSSSSSSFRGVPPGYGSVASYVEEWQLNISSYTLARRLLHEVEQRRVLVLGINWPIGARLPANVESVSRIQYVHAVRTVYLYDCLYGPAFPYGECSTEASCGCVVSES